MIQTFLFDFDGTVADSVELILASYRHTFEVHRGAPRPDEEWLAGIGTPLMQQLAGFTDDPLELQRLFDTYREHSLASHDALIERFDGMEAVLRQLKARGVRLGVVTSKKRVGLDRGLAALALEDVFEVTVCADDTTEHKPSPVPVLLALELLGVGAEGAVFIGDSLHDLHSGRRAGVQTGAALWGPFDREKLAEGQPDFWLERPEDVLSLLGTTP